MTGCSNMADAAARYMEDRAATYMEGTAGCAKGMTKLSGKTKIQPPGK